MHAAIDSTLNDIRYAWRTLRRSPGFTFFAVLTIALGLGANAAIFSLVDGVLLKSVGYPEPERIVLLWEKPPGGLRNGISAANYIDWAQQSRSFDAMAAVTGATMSYRRARRLARLPRVKRDRCALASSRRRTSTSSASGPLSAARSLPPRINAATSE